MPTDNHPLDQFFRDKNAELPAGTGRADEHWQQMQALLNQGQAAAGQKRRRPWKGLAAAALIPLLAILSLLTYRYFNQRSYDPQTLPSIARQLPVPAATQPVINQDSLRNQAILDSFLANWNPVLHYVPFQLPGWFPGSGNYWETRHSYLLEPEKKLLEPQPGSWLAAIYGELKKKPDYFQVPFDKDTLITCREGTEIIIPAHAFARKDGSPVKEKVDFRVEEYYKPSDMVAARLATHSGGAMLGTAGMLLIRAFLAGEELKLAPQKNLLVRMPTDDYDDKMQLFLPAADTLKPGADSLQQVTERVDLYAEQKDSSRRTGAIVLGSASLSNVMQELFSTPDNWVPRGQPQQRWWYRPQVTLPGTDRYQQVLGPNGEADGSTVTFIVKPGVSKAEVRRELENRYMSGVKIKVRRASRRQMKTFEFPGRRIDFAEAYGMGLISREDSIRFAGMVKIYNSPEQLAPRFEDRYSFSLSSLGWINCDKFLNDPRPKLDLVFQAPDIWGHSFVPMLVFPALKSVQRGYFDSLHHRFIFPQVPEGEDITFICVGEDMGHVRGCLINGNTSARNIAIPQLEGLTAPILRDKLALLDW